jgi:hypothetical protein
MWQIMDSLAELSDKILARLGSGIPERVRQTIESKKSMLTIFFSPHTFLIMNGFPHDEHLITQYFIDLVIMPLSQTLSIYSGDTACRRF